MTKFDFKKWVIEHKHGKKSLDEQRGGRDAANPLTMCSVIVTNPTTGVSDLSLCHRFSQCVNGQNAGGNEVILNDDPFANPQDFYNTMCPGCVPGDVIEMSDGRKWIYEGTGINAAMNAITPMVSLVGPSTCIMSVMGCMDPGANNFNSSVTQDDGSCAYGYDCGQLFNPPKYGLTKCNKNMQAGTNGTFQTLQSCVASGCEPIPADTGKFELPTNKRPQGEPMGPTEY